MSERSPYHCPRCHEMIWVGRGPDVVLHGCAKCRGVWMDRQDALRLAQGLLDARSVQLVARLDAGRRGAHGYRDAAVGDAGRRACPVCYDDLHPTLTHASIEIDVCEDHGVFFDVGEIRAVNRASRAARRQMAAQAEAHLAATAATANLELARYVVGRNLFGDIQHAYYDD